MAQKTPPSEGVGRPSEATELLLAWRDGDRGALDRLMPLVEAELRAMARRLMSRERRDHTLQPTALINEAFLRLVDVRQVQWQGRVHFLAMAARAMRRVLVEFARARQSAKRGGGAETVTLDAAIVGAVDPARDVVALHDALSALASIDPRKSQVIELRFFGGLSVEETAEALGVSPETVMRDWKFARAWLFRELSGAPASRLGTQP